MDLREDAHVEAGDEEEVVEAVEAVEAEAVEAEAVVVEAVEAGASKTTLTAGSSRTHGRRGCRGFLL